MWNWVIPALEQCYLRHVHGLEFVRQLFERINIKEIENGIISCDSWALVYLKHVLLGQHPEALVVQTFRKPDETLTDKSLLEGPADIKSTIGILPWDKLDLPAIPSDINPESSIPLHSLLLHNGLSQVLLSNMLPGSTNIVSQYPTPYFPPHTGPEV